MNASETPDEEARALEGLLRWYVAMGADAVLDDVPHNRFAQPETRSAAGRPAPQPASIPPAPLGTGETPPASADAFVRQAEELAAGAQSLDELRARWERLPGCGLSATASQMIFAGGQPGAPLMLIGGAPESDDERQGAIFSGPRGLLLDGMLRAIGLDRTGVYLANVLPWRPPGNRPPSRLELALCLPFTRRHIALATPRIILCLGERAAQPLLGTTDPISRLRGRWMTYEGETATVKLLATFPLAYLMSQPLQKRRAWADLQMVAAELSAG